MLGRVAMALTVLLPILPIVGLLAWAEWRDRRRAALVARQIRLTDAIGAELGAVVAPVVRGLGGAWRVDMTLPLGRPALVGRVLEITHRVLPGRYEIRLAPRMEPIASRRPPGAPIRRMPTSSRSSVGQTRSTRSCGWPTIWSSRCHSQRPPVASRESRSFG